ncbi:Serine/threonine-protein kinase UCN [Hibiscus syriacus]|uniref:non-specific serine/threonine protein kinase n=1 Tax=Hibiscus syriacus TaxID=106335 RepID=A0A6A2ZLB7_HIBSY|nr:serine/threonine-protein kinase UCNL-like [Hibiscus syriacus]KAE8692824.1 Serine/threonine-protein kinase UCN [Hibiscus syriacus]
MESPSPSDSLQFNFESLKAIKILGKGATGTVFLVHDTATDPTARSPFALKVVQRSNNGGDRRARWEIGVLKMLHHPFLPRLLGCVETDEFFAWGVPYCPGADLNVLRNRQNDGVFSAGVIRFYLAEILCALEYLHSLGVVYRDLKPENILVQRSGHVTLTDFDLSRSLKKKPLSEILSYGEKDCRKPSPEIPVRCKCRVKFKRWIAGKNRYNKALKKPKSARVSPVSRRKSSFSDGERSNSFVGTEEYVSPEVVRGDGHEFAVDWWALGILSYEMLYGTTPFKGKNRKETFRNVVAKEPVFMGPRNALIDLIGRLLQKDPKMRLGYHGGACEIKDHPIFEGVRWDLLTEVLRPPFIPSRDDGELTEKATAGRIDIREYFNSLKAPSAMPSSPLRSPSSEHRQSVSFTEF